MARSSDQKNSSKLLLTLGEVSELVSHSHDLRETLSNIVNHIRTRFKTDVCSVYTVEKLTGDLVLSATIGLRSDSVDRVRMSKHEGLTGLVAEKKAPVAVEDAPNHPRYRYFPESGEEQYHSFLGVPLIQGGEVQGVLVVQHRESRGYSANETRLLTGVAAQLATLVTNAQLTHELTESVRRQQIDPQADATPRLSQVHGVSASPGFAYGKALRFEAFDFADPRLVSRPVESAPREHARLQRALEQSRGDIDRAAQHLVELLGEQFGALMQSQRVMLEDSTVQRDLRRLIDDGASVEQAIVLVCDQYLRAFARIDNQFFFERIYDIKDVFRRVLSNARPASELTGGSEPVIVAAHEVSLLELFAADLSRVRGIVVEKGGSHSHVAILARSLKIPMLTQTHRLLSSLEEHDELFIDADSGVVYINPDAYRRQICQRLLERQEQPIAERAGEPPPPIRLETTVNLLPEIVRTVRNGGQAVGMYRSELMELARRAFPTEEEQLEAYRKMLSLLDGRSLTVRTLDLRPDKLYGLDGDPRYREQSWDWRLVHQLPHVQELVRTQLRACLRAAADGPLRILFPMITTNRQLHCALRLLDEARQSLIEEGMTFEQKVPVGLMIEVAAAAMYVRQWAPLVDFLCIGSNDLLHSLLGIERDDDRLLLLKSPLDLSYLKTVRHVIRHAHAAGKCVTICGEAASNPRAALALYVLGADALSVPPDDLPKIRAMFREAAVPADRTALCRRLLGAEDSEQAEEILAKAFMPAGR